MRILGRRPFFFGGAPFVGGLLGGLVGSALFWPRPFPYYGYGYGFGAPFPPFYW